MNSGKRVKTSQRRSQHEIDKEFGISMHSVQVTQKKHASVGRFFDVKKTDRPLKLDRRDQRSLLLLSICNPKLSGHQIMDECNIITGAIIHTARKAEYKTHLNGCIAEKISHH